MTYCVGIRIAAGLVLLSDTRTNAGIDNISRFKKMFTFEAPGERVMAMMVAGNLSITQGVVSLLKSQIQRAETDPAIPSILTVATMTEVVQLVAAALSEMQHRHRSTLIAYGVAADASILVAGQRRGGRHRLFLIYSAGNFIEATEDTAFLQIGELKYGKPILDRLITPDTAIDEAVKAACVSMDSTIRSNLSVGLPLDIAVIRTGELRFALRRRIAFDDEPYTRISSGWSDSLRQAFQGLPALPID